MFLCLNDAERSHLGGERREDLAVGAGAEPGLHSLRMIAHPHCHLQEMLLAAHHAARPADPTVPDRLLRGHPVLVHQIRADQRARAAQTRLAVHRHAAGVGLQNRDELQHLGDCASIVPSKRTLRETAVGEVEVEEVDAPRGKAGFVVGGFVETDHHAHAQLREERQVVLRSEGAHVVDHFRDVVRAGEREETVDDDPVHVAVLHAVEELVLSGVEETPLKDVFGDRDRQPFEAMLPSELKITWNEACNK